MFQILLRNISQVLKHSIQLRVNFLVPSRRIMVVDIYDPIRINIEGAASYEEAAETSHSKNGICLVLTGLEEHFSIQFYSTRWPAILKVITHLTVTYFWDQKGTSNKITTITSRCCARLTQCLETAFRRAQYIIGLQTNTSDSDVAQYYLSGVWSGEFTTYVVSSYTTCQRRIHK